MKLTDKKIYSGTFILSSGEEYSGELSFEASRPKLTLFSATDVFFDNEKYFTVTGTLSDLTKVTLLGCYSRNSGSRSKLGDKIYYAEASPHFIAYGDASLDHTERLIEGLTIEVDDGNTLFCHPQSTGSLSTSKSELEALLAAQEMPRKVEIGEYPSLIYFSGRREILSTDTVLGKLSVFNLPSESHGAGANVHMGLTSRIELSFGASETFDTAILKIRPLLQFLNVIVGRKLNVTQINAKIPSENDFGEWLEVMPVEWEHFCPNASPSDHTYIDLLIRGWDKPEQLQEVLTNWLAREDSWHDARSRFATAFEKGNLYDIDRLVGAANMFDILPSSAVPQDVEISQELEDAKNSAKQMFKALPASHERSSILSALGRLGKCSLKHKVRHRAKLVKEEIGEKLPFFDLAIDQSINCRNHYVHGTPLSFDYTNNTDLGIFLTDTLEFVFALSDLIEAGWDAAEWIKQGHTMRHPFHSYLHGYSINIARLRTLLNGSS